MYHPVNITSWYPKYWSDFIKDHVKARSNRRKQTASYFGPALFSRHEMDRAGNRAQLRLTGEFPVHRRGTGRARCRDRASIWRHGGVTSGATLDACVASARSFRNVRWSGVPCSFKWPGWHCIGLRSRDALLTTRSFSRAHCSHGKRDHQIDAGAFVAAREKRPPSM